MPQISVIVPVYNVEPYLCRCVDSILAQTFTDFELILVDDGSPDNCPAICDKYVQCDSRVQVIHKNNGGVSSARNAGLDSATGEYVTFCDSDDWYALEWLAELVAAMQSNQTDMVVGTFMFVTEEQAPKVSGHEVGTYSIKTSEDKISYIYSQLFGGKHGWEIWSHLFRADIIEDNKIRFCETCENFAEDLGFVLEYLLHANCVVSIEFSGYYYLMRNGSMMRSSVGDAKLNAHNEISLRFLSQCQDYFECQKIKEILPIVHFLIMFCGYNRMLGTKQYRHLHKELKEIKRFSEWKKYTKQIFRCRKELEYRFGKYNARRMLLLSHYCLHGNWKLFSIESVLFYKFNKPEG